MSTRDERVAVVAASIRNNIHMTIRSLGGNPETLDGYQLAGWNSVEEAVEAHHDEAFDSWYEYAPKNTRETWKLRNKFEREWSAIKKAAI